MRIEVLIHLGDTEVYPLNKSEILIGSGANSDIIVPAKGISRKHVKVTKRIDDKFFVTDMGSTNGTFINEERILPGRQTEFTTFFPVRLSDNVLLSLLSDHEERETKELQESKVALFADGQDKQFKDATKVVGLSELNKIKTTDLIKKRDSSRKSGRSESAKSKGNAKGNLLAPILVGAVMIGGAAYFQYILNGGDLAETPEVQRPQQVSPPKKVTQSQVQRDLIDSTDILSKERLASFFTDLKCAGPKEIEICKNTPSLTEESSGVVQTGTSIVFLINEKNWLLKAQEILKSSHSPYSLGRVATLDEIYKIAFMEFFSQELSKLDPKIINDRKLFFTFYNEMIKGQPVVTRVMAVSHSAFPQIISKYKNVAIKKRKNTNFRALNFLDSMSTYY